jgi:hypothetical protein
MFNLTPIFKPFAEQRIKHLNSLAVATTQEKLLLNLLNKAKDTIIGKELKFHQINSVQSFQKNISLHTYEDMWNKYWRNNFPCLENCTWPSTIPYFAVSSGTSAGTTKNIPLTYEMLKGNSLAGTDLLAFHCEQRPNSKILGGKCLFLGGSTDLTTLEKGICSGDLSGIQANNLPFWARLRFFPPVKIALIKDWEEKITAIAKLCLNQDIRLVGGVPSWLLIFFEKMAELAGLDQPDLSKLLPNLEILVHGGVNFTPYRTRFNEIMANSTAETREVYPASEGFIALADGNPDEGLRLLIKHGIFYEFIPLEELNSPNPTRHWLGDVETDINYAVVITTCAGLWSYLIGDTVRFINRNPHRLIITGRTSYMLSAFGEHLIGEEIEAAINKVAEVNQVLIPEYCVGSIFPKKTGELGRHLYILECSKSLKNLSDISNVIDKVLKERNEDYAAHRAEGFGLNPPEILIVPLGAFNCWMKSKGKLGGQHKVPRIINAFEKFQELQEYFRFNYSS